MRAPFIDHITVKVRDLEASRAFYAREGWRVVAGPLPGGDFGLDLMELRRAL